MVIQNQVMVIQNQVMLGFKVHDCLFLSLMQKRKQILRKLMTMIMIQTVSIKMLLNHFSA